MLQHDGKHTHCGGSSGTAALGLVLITLQGASRASEQATSGAKINQYTQRVDPPEKERAWVGGGGAGRTVVM